MKAAMTLSMVALLATAGAAMADGPMVLTETQLDHVTGGPIVIRELVIRAGTGPQNVEMHFEGQHPAQPSGNVGFTANPGFVLLPPSPALNGR